MKQNEFIKGFNIGELKLEEQLLPFIIT